MAAELPRIFEQLALSSAIPPEDHSVRCSICSDAYNPQPNDEGPIVLACDHILCDHCFEEELKEGRNECRVCGQLIIEDEDEEEWRGQLAAWYSSQPSSGSEEPFTEFALRGEVLFRGLCEELTHSIECVTLPNPTDPGWAAAEEWFRIRMPHKQLLRLLTFEHFAHVVNGEPSEMRDMLRGMKIHIERPQILIQILVHASRAPEYEAAGGEFLEPDWCTYRLIAALHERMSRSCDVLHERLYGTSRTWSRYRV
ncbi:MAG: hypothetical protein LQ350_004869 [Teloschistes chrysophthalmus]|nr:MAG: hypothetical protein LQ350_004869 [Niorma chrysophthalma]